jgi:hypothetical protein
MADVTVPLAGWGYSTWGTDSWGGVSGTGSRAMQSIYSLEATGETGTVE